MAFNGRLCTDIRQYLFIYINSLAYHPIRSTIKTLPATLPEVPGRAANVIHHPTPDHRRGLLMKSGEQIYRRSGVGVKRAGSAALRPPTFDGLAEALEVNFILILYLNRKTQLISASLLRLLSQPDVQTLSLR